MADKERIDVLLVKKGLVESREKAKALIMSGQVYIDEQKIDKAGEMVYADSNIIIRENLRYVSRGGLKLEKAVNVFNIDLKDKVCMDIGASTGGFTDCMLQNGARKVYSVDVGYGQLAWVLRQDPKVVVMERTNIRYVKPEDIGEKINFASVDVSFISLNLVLPVLSSLLDEDGESVCLIKPQFEAGREKVGKKGVVRDIEVHKEVVVKVIGYAQNNNLKLVDLSYSPIKGPEGNIEYIAHFRKGNEEYQEDVSSLVEKVVEASHSELE